MQRENRMTSPNLTDGTQRFLVRPSTKASTARGITYSASSLRRLFFSIRMDPDATKPAQIWKAWHMQLFLHKVDCALFLNCAVRRARVKKRHVFRCCRVRSPHCSMILQHRSAARPVT